MAKPSLGHLSAQDIKEIVNHPQWPRRPFVVVARLLGKCRMVKVSSDEDRAAERLVKKHKPEIEEAIRLTEELMITARSKL